MKKLPLISIFLLYTLFLDNAVYGQASLNTAIQNLANLSEMQYGYLGVCAMDAKTGEILASYNSNKSLIPASTLKAITTATGLGILGPNHTFETRLEHDGTITSQGVLKGNLYLTGTGDPMLGSNQVKPDETPKVAPLETYINELVEAVIQAGIKKIEGRIVGDDSYFQNSERPVASWQWNDIGNYYGTGACALNIHENRYTIYFNRSNVVGAITSVAKVEPEMPFLTFRNEVTLDKKGSGDNAYIFGAPYTEVRYLRGTIPIGNTLFPIGGAMPDPPFFAAFTLMNALEKQGIETQKLATTISELQREKTLSLDGKRTVLHTHQSPKLSEIATRTNEISNNLYAEAILKAIGKKVKSVGSTSAGIEALTTFWEERGVNMEGLFLDDGSGLSARNGVSPFLMSLLLSKISRDPALFDPFYASLPIGGQTGTVKYLFNRQKNIGQRIRIKSGSIRRVRAYCGYAKTKSGRLIAFTLIANNFTGSSTTIRQQMEKIMVQIAELP